MCQGRDLWTQCVLYEMKLFMYYPAELFMRSSSAVC